ncbi:hypothetical protein QNH18_11110 [Bacillus paralicheniformis]|uniref:hypothetical protein n=1 Tax=Bacillus paralicheniformis TaxID=1648923 RepID=UPI001177B57E|nr:hypothetical protein [Bacillus paralicheniformis]MDR9799791.1 hypothetical protein [Bacillus paralicheniformis]TWK42164.1 hypothetical protein CHCC20348_1085 [Bacillus paralicheniformis]TWK50491.1 hypothetical protein CHCC20347_3308 [Bacillus paralicheniformis]UWS61521.1 hypothetical protein N2384_27030 [Bacillus paralicheniformis]WHX84785.1 hypothetical protein QNH18_11110 [Bacillus paralicheniformis]
MQSSVLEDEFSGSIDRFDLCLSCLNSSNKLNFELTLNEKRYDQQVDLKLTPNLELINQEVANIKLPPTDLEILDETHKYQFEKWNDIELKLQRLFVQKVFEEQAAKISNDAVKVSL